jgi:hypothetical protein
MHIQVADKRGWGTIHEATRKGTKGDEQRGVCFVWFRVDSWIASHAFFSFCSSGIGAQINYRGVREVSF